MSLEDISNYVSDIRRSFAGQPLSEASVSKDPYEQFSMWFEDAVGAQIMDPFAMILASVSEIGYPSCRTVYMRSINDEGIIFHTNYSSQKGKEILNNPMVSAIFLWSEVDRQIRIAGRAEKVSVKVSDAYFKSRPRESQLGAWSSDQSEIIENREALIERYDYYEQKFKGLEIPRPENWGGFNIKPEKFEFWQGRPNRLHDRIMYLKDTSNEEWTIQRLAP